MADLRWAAGIAIGSQNAFGDFNSTITSAGVGGATTEADGIVKTSKDFGTGESGITIPQHVREAVERADVPGSFTRVPNGYERTTASGLAIGFELKGNGKAVTATIGEAVPAPGINDTLQAAGLVGADDGTPAFVYIPAIPIYATIKLFLSNETGDPTKGFVIVYQDCLVESLELPHEGGETVQAVANWTLGSIHTPATAAPFPTFAYGNQATLSPPVVQNAGFIWPAGGALDRCFQTMGVTVSNTIEEFPCSNSLNGKRFDQSGRSIDISSSLAMDDTDAGKTYAFDQLEQLDSLNLGQATWEYGDSSSVYNELSFDVTSIQVDDLSYDRAGSIMTAEVEGHAAANQVSPVPGDEFSLTFK